MESGKEREERMTRIKTTEKWLMAALLLLMVVAFYLMCASNPLRWDDLMYQYVWYDHKVPELLHPVDLDNRVDDVGEAFLSQCHHYTVMNGRFIVHFITQCFCGFIGKGPFNAVNALVYLAFLVLGLRFVGAKSLGKVAFVLAGLWLLPPVQWILSFDVVFPINYLWSAVACLAFVLLFHKMSLRGLPSWWQNALLVFFGVLCGNFHEGYSLLVSGALFFYALFHFKKLNASQWCLIVGMWIGTLTVIGSPGIWNRAAGASAETLQETLTRKLDILRYSKRLYLLIALLAVGCFVLGRKQIKKFFVENQIAFMVVVLGFLLLFMLPYYSQRMGFPMELFAVLLSLKLLLRFPIKTAVAKPIVAAMVLLMVAHAVTTVIYAQKVGEEYAGMLEEYQASPDGVAHRFSFEVPKPVASYVYRLGEDSEVGLVSFTMKKEMIVKP